VLPTRFVCTGALVDPDAPRGDASFRATASDLAGNLAASPEGTVVLQESDRVAPSLVGFRASPAIAREGVTVTLTFESTEELPSGARAPAPNPEVTFAGATAVCVSVGNAHACSVTVFPPMEERSYPFDVVGADAVGNTARVTTAASVLLDFTAPVVGVTASPNPATKGEPISFTVISDEALDPLRPPAIEGSFLSGTPACSAVLPTRFVCSGALVDPDAPRGPASFGATAADLAGNLAASLDGTVLLQESDRIAPGLVSFQASPAIARAGATVTLTFESTEELPPGARAPAPNPEVGFAGATAVCASAGNAHACTVTVLSPMEERSQTFEVAAADAAGNETRVTPPDAVPND
jgi:predicted secreted protein